MIFFHILFLIILVLLGAKQVKSNVTLDIVDVLIKEKTYLKEILLEERNKIDKIISELHPDLANKIALIKEDVHKCYDQGIMDTEMNIFKTKLKTVLETFFHSFDFLLKNVSREELQKRVKIVLQNIKKLVEMIIKCVHDKRKGKPTVKLGVTPLAFYGDKEIYDNILNHELSKNRTDKMKLSGYGQANGPCNKNRLPSDKPTPAEFSWKNLGYVSPVVWQGKCRGCYALAAVSAFESQYMIRSKTKNSVKFSVQKVLNCVGKGCEGGRMDEVDQFFKSTGASLDGYAPYIEKNDQCRQLPPALFAEHACSHSKLTVEEMKRLVYRNGPASVAFDGNSKIFQELRNGPFIAPCGTKINHALTLVGWDRKYWILKNSWSRGWGVQGYLYLPIKETDRYGRVNDNKCGVREMFSQAVYGLKV